MPERNRRDTEERQARIAERLAVVEEAPGVRHVFDGPRLVGKTVAADDDCWHLYGRSDGEWVEMPHVLVGGPEDTDEADRHAVGWIAEELAQEDAR